jgi:hypothetical protein
MIPHQMILTLRRKRIKNLRRKMMNKFKSSIT